MIPIEFSEHFVFLSSLFVLFYFGDKTILAYVSQFLALLAVCVYAHLTFLLPTIDVSRAAEYKKNPYFQARQSTVFGVLLSLVLWLGWTYSTRNEYYVFLTYVFCLSLIFEPLKVAFLNLSWFSGWRRTRNFSRGLPVKLFFYTWAAVLLLSRMDMLEIEGQPHSVTESFLFTLNFYLIGIPAEVIRAFEVELTQIDIDIPYEGLIALFLRGAFILSIYLFIREPIERGNNS